MTSVSRVRQLWPACAKARDCFSTSPRQLWFNLEGCNRLQVAQWWNAMSQNKNLCSGALRNGLATMLGKNHRWPSSSCSGIGWGREKSAGKTASAGPTAQNRWTSMTCTSSSLRRDWQVPSDNSQDLRGLVEVEILPNRWDQIIVFVSLAHGRLKEDYPAHQGNVISDAAASWPPLTLVGPWT